MEVALIEPGETEEESQWGQSCNIDKVRSV